MTLRTELVTYRNLKIYSGNNESRRFLELHVLLATFDQFHPAVPRIDYVHSTLTQWDDHSRGSLALGMTRTLQCTRSTLFSVEMKKKVIDKAREYCNTRTRESRVNNPFRYIKNCNFFSRCKIERIGFFRSKRKYEIDKKSHGFLQQ